MTGIDQRRQTYQRMTKAELLEAVMALESSATPNGEATQSAAKVPRPSSGGAALMQQTKAALVDELLSTRRNIQSLAEAVDELASTQRATAVPHAERNDEIGGLARALDRLALEVADHVAGYRNISETASDAIVTINAKSDILTWNAGATRIFGHTTKEAVGQKIFMVIPEHRHLNHSQGLAHNAARVDGIFVGKPQEGEGLRKNGEIFPAEVTFAAWPSKIGPIFCGILRDVTERKRAEQELAAKEAQLRAALEHMSGAFFMVDKDLKLKIFNENFKTVAEVPDEYVQPGAPLQDIIRIRAERGDFGPGDPEDLLKERVGSYQENKFARVENSTPSGRVLELLRAPTENGGTVALINDVTERKRADEELQESRTLLTNAIESTSDGFSLYDADNQLIICNSAFKGMYQYSETDLAGTPDAKHLLGLDIQRGIVDEDSGGIEITRRRKERFGTGDEIIDLPLADGRWLQIHSQRTSEGGTVTLHVDVTERCPSSYDLGHVILFPMGGSGSSRFDVMPLFVDGSSGGFGWSVS